MKTRNELMKSLPGLQDARQDAKKHVQQYENLGNSPAAALWKKVVADYDVAIEKLKNTPIVSTEIRVETKRQSK